MGGNNSKKLETAPTVVVIGGGYAGCKVAQSLDNDFNVVLVDRKDHFLHNMAAPRAMVDSSFARAIAMPFPELKNGHIVTGQVTKATNKEVFVDGLESPLTGFDYLVLATGSSYAFPFKVASSERQEMYDLYDEVAHKIKDAKSVVCVGGGSTGMEAAAEIAETYPDCQVTLVHSGDHLQPGPWKEKFVTHITEQIKRFPNVTVILKDRVLPVESDGGAASQMYAQPQDGMVTTEQGRELACDLLFWCVGGQTNSNSYREHFSDAVGPGSRIVVNEFLQVQGHSNVFAAGDCSSAGPYPTVNFAWQHSKLVATNIQRAAKGKSLNAYKPGPPINATQLGHTYGSAQLPFGIVLGSRTTQMIKRDLATSTVRGELGHSEEYEFGAAGEAEAAERSTKLERLLHMDPEAAEELTRGLKVDESADLDHT
eukprot:TRINITY_DN12980_c0_g1_i1.p1 TRINITY_DN12980_c0_g1~~TRINITY_DN12980_c0_g1_i1.p1  ORF type:complete len:426 (+),score=114.76 TRINITY_DN12980_c0_g1_i1:107-1384(+)